MAADAVEVLRGVNDNLCSGLARLRPERNHCSAITAQELAEMLADLLWAADCLRSLKVIPGEIREVEQDISEYRDHLEKLRELLPDLHCRLVAEKARLQTAQAHMTAAGAWAEAGGKTL